ncbi:MAG: AAA family ATPase [Promethearchaeota archaeon]
MTQVVAVSGKGGVGKTTVTAMMLKYISKYFYDRDVLIVDADPAANIPEVVGLKSETDKTVSKMTDVLKERIEKGELPPGFDKQLQLQSDIFRILYEEDDYDILVMGRGEGEGCYCYVNNLLKSILDPLEDEYDLIIMDMPAGLEHLSRRTDKNVDDLIIVTDMSKMGFNTMERILEVVKEVKLDITKFWVIGNRFNDSAKDILRKKVDTLRERMNVDIEIAGFVPANDEVQVRNLMSEPLIKVPDDNPAYQAVETIAKKILKH